MWELRRVLTERAVARDWSPDTPDPNYRRWMDSQIRAQAAVASFAADMSESAECLEGHESIRGVALASLKNIEREMLGRGAPPPHNVAAAML